ncbi:hypothetical protein [Nitrosospira briensis]|uniref:hypothetical protein n=1 Tax=Nitrosospira briensis TaxID=35799 RepID=UPI0018D08DB2|nr:hypothetical protein [Nitrosospira briensis]
MLPRTCHQSVQRWRHRGDGVGGDMEICEAQVKVMMMAMSFLSVMRVVMITFLPIPE